MGAPSVVSREPDFSASAFETSSSTPATKTCSCAGVMFRSSAAIWDDSLRSPWFSFSMLPELLRPNHAAGMSLSFLPLDTCVLRPRRTQLA
jgi:hypothetical protein